MKTVGLNYALPSERQVGHLDSAPLTPLLLQTVVFTVLYQLVFLRWLSPVIRRRLLASNVGQTATVAKEGFFLRSLLEEATFALTLSAHHLLAGGLMFAGYLQNSPGLWISGISAEMGYEIVDTLALLNDSWPYSAVRKKYLKVLPLAHHIPTLLVIPILVRLGYHGNPDVQTLGWALIGAGGIGFLAEGLKKGIDRELNLTTWLLIHSANAILMFALRFLVFPSAALRALTAVKADGRARLIYPVCFAGFLSLIVFNTVLMMLYFWKLVQALRQMFIVATRRALSMPQKIYIGEEAAKQT